MSNIALSQEVVTQQVQERLKALHSICQEIEEERQKGEPNFTNYMKIREKQALGEERRPPPQQKMKTMIREAISDAEKEEELLRKALNKITEIRTCLIQLKCSLQARNAGSKETIRRGTLMKMLQSTAQTLPLFVGKLGEKPPSLCGAIPADSNYVAKVGDMVAALVRVSEEEENWILAEVVGYNSTTNKYEVDDIDEEEKDKKRHLLSRRKVVPLPLMRANPETDPHALFPKGTEGTVASILNNLCRSNESILLFIAN